MSFVKFYPANGKKLPPSTEALLPEDWHKETVVPLGNNKLILPSTAIQGVMFKFNPEFVGKYKDFGDPRELKCLDNLTGSYPHARGFDINDANRTPFNYVIVSTIEDKSRQRAHSK